MLFMKGNAKEPKCGFSRQIIELINETGLNLNFFVLTFLLFVSCLIKKKIMLLFTFVVYRVKYDSFDILSDEEVRQGLKEYSKWPTYPQLYVDG